MRITSIPNNCDNAKDDENVFIKLGCSVNETCKHDVNYGCFNEK